MTHIIHLHQNPLHAHIRIAVMDCRNI